MKTRFATRNLPITALFSALVLASTVNTVAAQIGSLGLPAMIVPATREPVVEDSCVSCHADLDRLQVEAGQAGAMAYLSASVFGDSPHGQQTCHSCHSGAPQASAMSEAHQGLILNPSA
ncbi:MAG: hypothetical protein KJ734_11230, partial [Chloroflexi bacterium]|nr:hypothetical protein [Chloroflexota bacterium]